MAPKRPIQHEIEAESRKAFDAIVPPRLVFRGEDQDYGIDGEVEEFGEDREATGRRFRVQLKGTSKTGSAAMRERISFETAEYYWRQHLPVLMVRYVRATGRLYGRWFHEFDPYYEHHGDTHLTFHWSESDELSSESFDALFRDVERILRLRSADLRIPISIHLDVPPGGAHGATATELDLAFDAGLRRVSGVLDRVPDKQDAELKVRINDEEIRANLSGVASVTFHPDDDTYEPDDPPDVLVNDAMTCVALALARAHHGDPAARVAVPVFPDSLLSAIPPFAGELAFAMVASGRVIEAIELAEALDQDPEDEARETSSALFMHTVRTHSEVLQPYEQDRFETALRARLERRVQAGRRELAAASAENVGRHLMNTRRPWEAIEFFEQAITLDRSRETADLAQMLAGARFLGGNYSDAVSAYDRALELAEEPDPHLESRRADALLYAGRYRMALDAFHEIQADNESLAAWVYVKVRALEWVLASTGIDEQEPDPLAANRLAEELIGVGTLEEAKDVAARISGLDAASPLGWFNYARALLDAGRERDAMHAYLTAAVMREGDVEAWVNVALLAGNTGDDELFAASAITGNRLNTPGYVQEFARQLRVSVQDRDIRNEILSAVRAAIAAG